MVSNEFANIEEAARIARALSHPLRLRILNELRDGGAYVMHLTTSLDRPQANISQHLMVLREAGLVTSEREGMTVIYHVRDPQVTVLVDYLLDLARSRQGFRAADRQELPLRGRQRQGHGRRGGCRCPRCQGKK